MKPTLFIAIAAAMITCAGCRNDEIAADVQAKRDAKKAAAASNYLATIDADIARAEKWKKSIGANIERNSEEQNRFGVDESAVKEMKEDLKKFEQVERDIEELKRKRLEFEAR